MTAHTSLVRIDAQNLPAPVRDEAERRMAAIEDLTEQVTGIDFRDEPASTELAALHEEFATLIGLRPERPDERPVAFRCDCGAYRLVTSDTRTRPVWNDDTETDELAPVCDCPLNAGAVLGARTELFLIAINAEAAARTVSDTDRQAEFAELGDDAMWTARHCDPGGTWDRSNAIVRDIITGFAKRAADAGLPPYARGPARTLLLDATTTVLLNLTHVGRPDTTRVSFPATHQRRWNRITGVITTFADNTQRHDLSYPHPALGAFLDELAAMRPPRPGTKLTFTLNSTRG